MTYAKELEFAKHLADEAGKIMRRYFKSEDIGTEWKQDSTPLTIADTTINEMVIKKVQKTFPDHGVIGEEDSFETKRDFVWVVDPIDGTMPFSLDIPVSTFSLALVDRSDGQPVVAALYDPYLNHLFWAATGGGAYLNGRKLKTTSSTGFKQGYACVDGTQASFRPGTCRDLLRDQGTHCISLLSHAYGASRVASGQFIGSIFGNSYPWDVAATALLTREAGGVVTDLEGQVRRFDEYGNGCIQAANKTIHSKLVDIVGRARP